MMEIEEKASLCALGRIFGFKPRTALALISHCGSARSVFRLSTEEKEALLGPYSALTGQIDTRSLEAAHTELESLHRKGIRYTGYTEDGYPSLLKECDDAPVGLYIRSGTPDEELWKPELKVAVIGTRDISQYGREWCERTVRGLAESGSDTLIVSGLAIGTDICAHRAALEAGIPTVGVMATGPESIYPLRNIGTAEKMASSPGCALVTDYPPGTPPLPLHFLRRNRIIAGLTQATILIESKIRGGGMMTSRLAFSYSRDVFALPGRADDLRSQGCNRLIREKIAEPLTSIPDLLDSLGVKGGMQKRQVSDMEMLTGMYSGQQSQDRIDLMHDILEAVRAERGLTIEEIASLTGQPYHRISNLCTLMESDGILAIDLLQRCSIRGKNF